MQASPQYREEGPGRPGTHARVDERTALLRSSRHAGYVDPYDTHLQEGDEEDMEEEFRAAELRRQKELIFGPWPGRLLNLHVSMTYLSVPLSFSCELFAVVVVAHRAHSLLYILF